MLFVFEQKSVVEWFSERSSRGRQLDRISEANWRLPSHRLKESHHAETSSNGLSGFLERPCGSNQRQTDQSQSLDARAVVRPRLDIGHSGAQCHPANDSLPLSPDISHQKEVLRKRSIANLYEYSLFIRRGTELTQSCSRSIISNFV